MLVFLEELLSLMKDFDVEINRRNFSNVKELVRSDKIMWRTGLGIRKNM